MNYKSPAIVPGFVVSKPRFVQARLFAEHRALLKFRRPFTPQI
jgi:hypothetical protein